MKDLALLLAAILFILTSCTSTADSTSAAPTQAPEVPESTAETATEPAVEETGTLYGMNDSYSRSICYETFPALDAQGSLTGTNVYKNDLDAGQVTLFYHCDDLCNVYPYVTSDAVYLITSNRDDNKIIALSLDGTLTHEIPFDTLTWGIALYSDRYFYCISDRAPYHAASGLRLDLQTGETTPWELPAETTGVLDAAGDFAVSERILSDYPIPFPNDEEISDALFQNSLHEFDLTDVATGKPTKKIAEFPYKGVEDGGTSVVYTYLGKAGNEYYFTGEHYTASANRVSMSVLRVGSDGTQQDLGISSTVPVNALCQNGDIQWLYTMDGSLGTLTVYDLQGTQLAQLDPPAGVEAYYPVSVLDDGRILLVTGYDRAHDYMSQYATIDADAFLSGSSDFQRIEFVG